MEEASTGVDRRIGIVREERWPRVWNWFLWLIKDRLYIGYSKGLEKLDSRVGVLKRRRLDTLSKMTFF